MEWHNKLHSLSHTGLITIRLKKGIKGSVQKYSAAHSMLQKHETNWRCFPLSSYPFCSLKKKEKKKPSAQLADYHQFISASLDNSPLGFVLFFFKKEAILKAAMPLSFTEFTMGSVVTPFTLLFMPSPVFQPLPKIKITIKHCLNAAYIIVSDIKREYIRSIESLNMKGNERTVSRGFVTLFPLFKKQLIQRIKRRQCTTQYRYSECFHMQQKNSTGQGWQVSDSATQQNTTSNTPFREHTFPLFRYSALAWRKDQGEITEIICQRWQKK